MGHGEACSAQQAAPHDVDDAIRLPADDEHREVGFERGKRSGIPRNVGGPVRPTDMVCADCPRCFFRNDAVCTEGLGARWIKVSLIFTLVLGVVGTAYQLVALRSYAPLADAEGWGAQNAFSAPQGLESVPTGCARASVDSSE